MAPAYAIILFVPHRIQVVALSPETAEFSDDVRRLFRELVQTGSTATLTGECSPPLDVFETDDAVEIAMDVPGVDVGAVRVSAKSNAILIVGEKAPRRRSGEASFHLVERDYGGFARVVRLHATCDVSRAKARLAEGELRVTIPKVKDRRGRAIPIAVVAGQPSA